MKIPLLLTAAFLSFCIPANSPAQQPSPQAPAPPTKAPVPVVPTADMVIGNYIPKAPLGSAMDNVKQQKFREDNAAAAAMSKIETLDLYAVVMIGSLNKTFQAMDNSRTDWTLEKGEAFPFLGYGYGGACVRLGTTWMTIPPESILLVRAADLPEAVDTYHALLAEYKRDLAADAQQAALDRANRTLSNIESNQRRVINQQWLINQQILGALQQRQAELQRQR